MSFSGNDAVPGSSAAPAAPVVNPFIGSETCDVSEVWKAVAILQGRVDEAADMLMGTTDFAERLKNNEDAIKELHNKEVKWNAEWTPKVKEIDKGISEAREGAARHAKETMEL